MRTINILKYYIEYRIGIKNLMIIIVLILSGIFTYLFVFAPFPVIVQSNLPSNIPFTILFNGVTYTGYGSQIIYVNKLSSRYIIPLPYTVTNYFYSISFVPSQNSYEIIGNQVNVSYNEYVYPNYLLLSNGTYLIVGEFNINSGFKTYLTTPIVGISGFYFVNETYPSYEGITPTVGFFATKSIPNNVLYFINASNFIVSPLSFNNIISVFAISGNYEYSLYFVSSKTIIVQVYTSYQTNTYSFNFAQANFTAAAVSPSGYIWITNGTSNVDVLNSQLNILYKINANFTPIRAIYIGPYSTLGNFVFAVSNTSLYIFNGISYTLFKTINFGNINAYSYDAQQNILSIVNYSNGISDLYLINATNAQIMGRYTFPYKIESVLSTANSFVIGNSTSLTFFVGGKPKFSYPIRNVNVII